MGKKTNIRVNNYAEGKYQKTGTEDFFNYNKRETVPKFSTILDDEKNIPSKALPSFSNGRDMNLVNMILNIESNNSNNYAKPLDVYSIYANMKELDFNNTFKNSLEKSGQVVKVPPYTHNYLSSLIKNDPNSFLVHPLLGKGHLWSTLIRRTDEGFSCLIINKGLRFWHDPIEEFVFKKESLNKLIDALKYAGAFKQNNIEDVYRKFINNSDKQYNTKINASPQKVGNCFTKNIQAGIKMAYATQDLSPEKMRDFRINQNYTPLGTPSSHRKTFKWNVMATEKMQKLFISKILARNPSIRASVEQSLDIYTSNKSFRNELKKDSNPTRALLKCFDQNNSTISINTDERIKKALRKLTPYTYNMKNKEISIIINNVKDTDYKNVYQKLNQYSLIGKASMSNLYFHFFMEAQHPIEKSLVACFDKSDSYSHLSPKDRTKELLKKLDPTILFLHKSKIMKTLSELYGNENAEARYSELKDISLKNQIKINSLKPSREEMKDIENCFPVVFGQVNHRISDFNLNIGEAMLKKKNMPEDALHFLKISTYFDENFKNTYAKGLCLANLGDTNGAIKEFSKSIALQPENPHAYEQRAKAYEMKGNSSAAREDLRKAIALDPELSNNFKMQKDAGKGQNFLR